MKTLKIFLVLLLMFGYSFLSSAQQTDNGIQQLGQELITALQNNNVDTYLMVHLNPADLEEFNKKTAKFSNKKQSPDDAEEALESMEEASKANFEEVIQKGITEQINWKDVHFTGVENTAAMQKEGDLYIINNPVVMFTYKDKQRKLRIDKIAKLNRGWVVVSNVHLE